MICGRLNYVIRRLVVQTNLGTFEGKFDFAVTSFASHPQVHLVPIVQYHDVIIGKIVLNTRQEHVRNNYEINDAMVILHVPTPVNSHAN